MCRYSKITFLILFFSAVTFFFYYNHIGFDHHFSLSQTTFNRIPDWDQDNQNEALIAFKKSCVEILKRDPNSAFSNLPESKTNSAWQTICLAATKISNTDKLIAKQFFETWFTPFIVKDNFNSQGLFTGYYLPSLSARLKKTKDYTTPIYGLPKDLVKVSLRLFSPDLPNKTIIGQLKDNTLILYPDRATINRDGINAPVLAWAHSPIDLFFAQIQGSALLQLSDQQQILIGYASHNGRDYTAIGKLLIANGAIDKKNISMQTIRAWLLDHPDQAANLLNQNASYVFFNVLTNGPLGSEQIPLTTQRSLAVDTSYIPLGAPIWLSTQIPIQDKPDIAFNRLLIAQDTGGAIKGIIRGDIYFGPGKDAEFSAGHMKQSGRYWILLPK